MTDMDVTWTGLKSFVEGTTQRGTTFLYRGQSNDTWGLVSTFHRLVAPSPTTYVGLLAQVHDQVSTWSGTRWNLTDRLELAAFLGYLQHHGFPTPLLDWSYSPYIAAYFAYDGIDDATPDTDHVTVFAFDHQTWQTDWTQVYDLDHAGPHVSVLESFARGNQKQLIQQGAYTFSTVQDQYEHIKQHEVQRTTEGKQERTYVLRMKLPVHEKPAAMRDLALMGITAMSLFPSVEGVCKHLRNKYFAAPQIGLTRTQRLEAFMEALRSDAPGSTVAESQGADA